MAMLKYTHGTMDLNEPVRQCIRDKNPDLVWDYVDKCTAPMSELPPLFGK